MTLVNLKLLGAIILKTKLLILTAAVILSSLNTEVLAQKSVHAVMQIKAEVIQGAQFQDELASDISDQLSDDFVSGSKLNLGQFSITAAEETEFTASLNDEIEMSNGQNKWSINPTMEVYESQGVFTFTLNGSVKDADPSVLHGSYTGVQVATIEYH